MADSESIKEIINQVAVQVAIVVMVAFRDTETGPWPATIQNKPETQRQRHGGLILEKPRLKWDALDRYIKLLNSELDVTNILENKVYEISAEEKLLVVKN